MPDLPLRRAKPPGDSEPGDQLHGDWTRERLLEMDERFHQRLERAIATGCETRQAAAATHGADLTRAR
jgi:hypothetical protein